MNLKSLNAVFQLRKINSVTQNPLLVAQTFLSACFDVGFRCKIQIRTQTRISVLLLFIGYFFVIPNVVSAQYKTGGAIPRSTDPVLPPLPPKMQKEVDERLKAKIAKEQEKDSTGNLSHEEGFSGEKQVQANHPPSDTIYFGGIRWIARNTSELGEPGNILFSGKESEIFVDEQKRLHLKLHRRSGYWHGVDIAADTSLGYGTYAIFAETKFDELPQNVQIEFGITPDATMDNYVAPTLAIQFTKLHEIAISPLRYVVSNVEQNVVAERKEKIFRSEEPFRMQGLFSTHAITWKKRSVEFVSYHDHGLPSKYVAALWDFSGSPSTGLSVPEATPTSVMRLRVWSQGAPLGGESVELVIKKIVFRPEK